MDVHKAAAWAQIIYLPAGLYCAYGTFATLHPEFQMPGVNPTVFDVSLGAFLLGVFLVIADKISGWSSRATAPPQQGKPAWQKLQWCNAERERLGKEVERLEKVAQEWQKKWEDQRGGSSARDETIEQLRAKLEAVNQPEIVPISFGREGFPLERGGPYGILLSNDGNSVALDITISPFRLGRWEVTFMTLSRLEPGTKSGIEIFMTTGEEGSTDLVYVLRNLQSAQGSIGEPIEFSINFRDLRGNYSSLCEMRLDSHAAHGLNLKCKEIVSIA